MSILDTGVARASTPRRSATIRNPGRYTPLKLTAVYMVATMLLYFFGPLPWPIFGLGSILIMLIGSLLMLILGYQVGITGSKVEHPSLSLNISKVVFAGTCLNLITFPIALYGYTGKLPTDITFDLSSQGDVYLARYQFLIDGEGGRIQLIAAVVRALAAPMIFGGIILGFRHWRSLGYRMRVALAMSVLLQVAFSFARATDKEIFDIAIFALVAWIAGPRRSLAASAKRAGVALLVLVLSLGIFVSRREARQGTLNICVPRADFCADPDTSALEPLVGPQLYGSSVVITRYVTQGYYGLSLASGLEFEPTFGLGHAPALRRGVELIVGDTGIAERTYHRRLGVLGWDERFAWSSLYLYFANDVSWFGVPVIFGLIGYALARSWIHATTARNDAAFVTLAFLVLLLAYSPANNQVAVSFEPYFAACFWAWRWSRTRDGTADAKTYL